MKYEKIVAEEITLRRETEMLFKHLEVDAFTRKTHGNKKLQGIQIKVANLGHFVVEEDEDVKQLFEVLQDIYQRKLHRLKKLQEKLDAIDTLLTDP